MGEGNHRLRAARELGIKKLPVRHVFSSGAFKPEKFRDVKKTPGKRKNQTVTEPKDMSTATPTTAPEKETKTNKKTGPSSSLDKLMNMLL